MGGFLLLRAVKWLLSLRGPCAVLMQDSTFPTKLFCYIMVVVVLHLWA